jgi:hypothetical protein
MLSCKETSLLVSQGRDRRLRWSERLGVRMHLWMCAQCRRYERQLNWLNGLRGRLDQAPEEMSDTELSPEAKSRIWAAIEAHRADGAHRHPH